MKRLIWTNRKDIFSFLTWLVGKILALNGYFITSIVFEIVSRMSGRRQYTMIFN